MQHVLYKILSKNKVMTSGKFVHLVVVKTVCGYVTTMGNRMNAFTIFVDQIVRQSIAV
jgi:F0F1-type ATP synthase epsilon subunit